MATITASAAGGNWNTNAAWVGSVQPTAADDVLLTAASGNITIPNSVTALCRSLDCTGYTGVFTMSTTNSNLNVGNATGGNVKFVSTMTLTVTLSSTINFLGSQASTVYTLTTAGLSMPKIVCNVSSTATLQLQDNITLIGALQLTTGTLDTNNKTITGTSMLQSGSAARTLTLGGSAISLSSGTTPWSFLTTTGLTVTANTAVLTMTGNSPEFLTGAINWNGLGIVSNGSGVVIITGNGFTIASLSRTGTALKTEAMTISGSFTVTGNLTLNGNSVLNRLFVYSSVVGTGITITCNGTLSAQHLDLRDITGAGSASWNLAAITGNSGDCGGNSGITFTASVTQTATGTASFSFSTHTWTTRVPLPQDDVVINNAFIASRVITCDMPRGGRTIDCSGCTGTPAFNFASGGSMIFGSLIFAAGMTNTTTNGCIFAGRSSYSITSGGATFAGQVTISAPGGTYTFTDNFICSRNLANALLLINGTLTANGNVSLTAPATGGFSMTGGTLNMGAGTWSLAASGTIWSVTGGVVNASTSTILISTASTGARNFNGGTGNTYATITYIVAGSTGSLTINDDITVGTINFSDASNARSLNLPSSMTIGTAFNVFGTSGKLMSVHSAGGGNHQLVKTGGVVSCDYLSLANSLAVGSATWYAGQHSTNEGSNTGWRFTGIPTGFFALINP